MAICEIAGCVSEAKPGLTQCAVHATGLRRYPYDTGRHCRRCTRRIKANEWMLEVEEGVVHYKACKPPKVT